MGLREYNRKRDFKKTPEPEGKLAKSKGGDSFVIQKHAASRLHYDFRLEMEGVLRSWAVPKGPSLDPKDKRLAVHVEDHPLKYGGFEGVIPKGEYGGGTVIVWDRGTWHPEENPVRAYHAGKIRFTLEGEKLRGAWTLFRMGGRGNGDDDKSWMLVKQADEVAEEMAGVDITAERPESVLTGLTLEEVAKDPEREWSRRGERRLRKAAPAAKTPKPRKPAKAPKLEGAREAPLPDTVAPQLCTLVTEVPAGDEWMHEIKFDGYRTLARIDGRDVRLFSRNANDWTKRMSPIAAACARLGVKTAILDGEVVVAAKDGVTSFQALQKALGSGDASDLRYYVFDLLYLDGQDLRDVALLERKKLLEKLLAGVPAPLVYSDHVLGQGDAFRQRACRLGLEGIVSKRIDKPHRGKRTPEWLKIRCGRRQELVIVGFTEPAGARKHFGALLLVYYEDGELTYAGKVGTGFKDDLLSDMRRKLDKLVVRESPVANPPRGAAARGVHWVKPELVADVEFTEWTTTGQLRHPSFEGLREDKPAKDVVRERAQGIVREKAKETEAVVEDAPKARKPAAAKRKAARAATRGKAEDVVVAGVRISNPQRVLYPELGITKLDVARYYEAVGDWMLPHAASRLLTLVRCPEGRTGQCFYQKHVAPNSPDSIHRMMVQEKSGSDEYVYVRDVEGIVSLLQMGVLEIHGWGSRVKDIEKPDLVVIDLDPSPEVPWKRVVESAFEVREKLESLGFESFVKTTGGKGLHVCVPLQPKADWDVVKPWTKKLVEDISKEHPGQYLTTASKEKRKGRIFLDYLRNGRGATAVLAYSTRSREGATVSTPIRWEELTPKLDPKSFTVQSVPKRLAKLKRDPWEGFEKVKQRSGGR